MPTKRLIGFRPTRYRVRRLVQAAADAIAIYSAVLLATGLRYDFDLRRNRLDDALVFGLVAVAVFAVMGYARGLYRGHQSVGSFEELRTLVGTIGLVTATLLAVAAWDRLVPLSVPMIASTLVLTFAASYRYIWRWIREVAMRPSEGSAERLVVIGAGEAGQQIITALLRNPSGRYLPVALLDDDPSKSALRVRGVPVRGSREDLPRVAASVDAEVALLAIPSVGSSVIRETERVAQEAGIRLLVLPSVSELYGVEVGVSDIRPVTSADLLGRHEHDTDVASVAGYLTGKRVLVTGAGGSIGSELCRQIYRYAPEHLVMLERDESALHAVQLSIEGRALLDSRNLVVADIRDRDRMDEVFAEHRPQVVFHAAALKHLPLLEMHPAEALKTNVWGTASLLDASSAAGVERFVNISTDKAASPTSVLGYTKRLAERLTSAANDRADGVYLSVRFGNVLGSRGSVLTAFRSQIDSGGPVTVTHPDVTRFFMTVEEAVQLVIHAGAVGSPGEALVLDMGEPVRIDDVARRLIAEADRPINIVYTGLRPGEKLHEDLFGEGEADTRPCHPGISHVDVPPLEIDRASLEGSPSEVLVERLRAWCREPVELSAAQAEPASEVADENSIGID